MRSVLQESQFTPFGLWIRQYLRDSRDGLSVTNLDYVFEDFNNKKIMLVEEKQSCGKMHKAQLLTFNVIDYALYMRAEKFGYDYWGFYLLQFPKDCTMPGPGMRLNDLVVSTEQLVAHLNFEKRFCEPINFPWRNAA